MKALLPICSVSLLAIPSFLRAEEAGKVDFAKEVRPILSNRCFKCHGPDEGTREGGLRLDLREAALGEGDSGKIAIVPGKPDESEFMKRLHATDPDDIMPPASAKMEMSDKERDVLRQWIAQGAEYKEHWAFVAPVKAALPEGDAVHPIDQFIRKHLAEEKMKASPEAGKYQLIRRVSLDLTGLPPSPEETRAFIEDTSPDAYDKLVDRLLASPAYGERWARRWMDLARYADTNGYEKDRERSIWPWRDWVIRAINDDMPFDQFTIRQLAGDMLPDATPDDIVATGFHRNTMLNEEGGIDPLEFRYHAMTDRVATTGTTWLGMTVGCAQCHTHKYDPILHTEYFQFMAFLNNTEEIRYELPDATLAGREAARDKQVADLIAALPDKWPAPPPPAPKLTSVTSESGETAKVLPDQSALFSTPGANKDSYTLEFEAKDGVVDRIRLDALADAGIPSGGPGRTSHGNFVLSEIEVYVRTRQVGSEWQRVELAGASAAVEQPNFPVAHAIDGNPETGWAVQKDGTNLKSDKNATFTFKAPVDTRSTPYFMVKLVQNFGGSHTMGRVRLAVSGPEEPTHNGRNDAKLAYESWVERSRAATIPWTTLEPVKMESNEPVLTLEKDKSIFVSGDTTKDDRFVLTYKDFPAGTSSIRLEALSDKRLPAYGPGKTYYEGPSGDFLVYDVIVKADGKELKIASASSSNAASGGNAMLAIDEEDLTGWGPGGRFGEDCQAVFNLAEPLPAATELTIELRMGRHYAATLGKFRLSATTKQAKAPTQVLPYELELALASGDEAKIEAVRPALTRYFLLNSPELTAHTNPIRELLKPLPTTTTLAMEERDAAHPRKTFLHSRGEYTQPANEVKPDVPAFLPPMDPKEPKNRLGFARWLVSRTHPLTARVTVNRQWQAFFGNGLVKTIDDFGFQGEMPSNQPLLDWLAVDFMENGWSMKKLHRQIVTSATYKQSSKVTPELLEEDPQNRLLARGPRTRVEAEMVRDIALSSAGLLSKKMYGPSVRPPQPDSVTEAAYGGMSWPVSQGEDRYRRALYTFAKRSAPFASSLTFDAPTGEACIPRREMANTPLQSLVLLNDEVYFEAAQVLGKKVAALSATPEEKAKYIFERCLTRPPEVSEADTLVTFHREQLERLKSGELKTSELMPAGSTDDEAAWMTVARILLNLDETITRN
ncbi:PSD1 and planctomycete cytochrome C domain-containing protein [Luteolibacter flavescens]|uniref:PSD1 and planctomycete cytochrome C domain-containing protein n=1 Tax=Luteolibacter flavescens TaxID=1859460 RepID=A0ABT3FRY8_9BACT|nr:PSD1 and planctomycete cytochrome C domain-containing protein [Luteolibacter flavescens]MCW1886338.1 PSD1 and planctomycete cytochrome C domain-containing protein [Luteolibacter flavescens]